MKIYFEIPLFLLAVGGCQLVQADEPTKPPVVTFGGFVDTYYAYDFDRPANHERDYGNPLQLAVTPTRHDEFNINLAFLDAKVAADRVRARVAIQAGTSVQAVYAGEANVGLVSGPSLLRNIQETSVGYEITDNFWVDAGIYPSHIGIESFVSRDNWNYSRSLMADFTPYYQSGVKLSYQATPEWFLQLHLINGWQSITQISSGKAVGAEIVFTPSDKLSFTYNNFAGPDNGVPWRVLNEIFVKYSVTEAFKIAPIVDYGVEGTSSWFGVGLLGRYQLTKKVALAARVEKFNDPNRVIVQPTNSATAFLATSATFNVDVELYKNLFWRTEVRGFWARDAVFPTATGFSNSDALATTSLSFSF